MECMAIDGPLARQIFKLEDSPQTLPLSINGETGRYVYYYQTAGMPGTYFKYKALT